MSVIEKHGQVVQESAKVVDGLAAGAMVGTVIGYLPAIAALFTIVWTGIRIYETATVQNTLMKWGVITSKTPREGDD